ncbi:MAG: hypothetical protein SWE60_10315 [Thermodesulfobacteriota bacterium]|nr:hypothetical protein [Thermodesulfobacteriota bacterium]
MTETKACRLDVRDLVGKMACKRARALKGWSLLSLVFLMAGCSGMAFRGPALEIGLRQVELDEKAVQKAMAVTEAPLPEALPEAVRILFSFLGHADPDTLVKTKPHAHAHWRLDRIYLLGDCVAVQFAEGHFMETIFFVRTRAGWRAAARIQPKDHL